MLSSSYEISGTFFCRFISPSPGWITDATFAVPRLLSSPICGNLPTVPSNMKSFPRQIDPFSISLFRGEVPCQDAYSSISVGTPECAVSTLSPPPTLCVVSLGVGGGRFSYSASIPFPPAHTRLGILSFPPILTPLLFRAPLLSPPTNDETSSKVVSP